MPPKTDPDATSGQKLLVLYSLLIFSGREFSLTELAGELRCSKQTVLRLLDQMEAGSFKGLLRESRNGRAYYRMQRPARRPVLALSPDSLEQLVLCRDLALHLLPKGMRDKLEQTLERAAALLPEGENAPDVLLPNAMVLTKGWIDYTPFQVFLDRIRTAMRLKTALSVSYRSVDREEGRTFDFAPQRLLSFREALYAQGWEVTGAGLDAKAQEGEPPSEDPELLLAELGQAAQSLLGLIKKINKTNASTNVDGKTLADLLAERDTGIAQANILREFLKEAADKVDRYSRKEVAIFSTVNVAEKQKGLDALSQSIRLMDTKIQELNWLTEIV